MDVDDFAPRLSFFFNAQIDFFEEIAKYRAARRIWARELRDTYGAKNPRSWLMRFHTQTAGVSLTAQQPLNNIVRTAIEALAGVLGGTQSLHTNSYDEALALPTEDAVRIALRTQQIIAHETGVTNTVDPLGGSYFVEALTDQHGGAGLRLLPPRSTSSAAWSRRSSATTRSARSPTRRSSCRRRSTTREQIVVGVNRYTEGDDGETPILRIDPALERKQIGRVQAVRARRDGAEVERTLAELRDAAATEANLMPAAGRVRPRARDRGRDGRGAPARLGRLHRIAGLLGEQPLRLPERLGVQLEEVRDLVVPAVTDEAHVVRVRAVGVVRRAVGELHHQREAVVVLRADLAHELERLDAGDRRRARRWPSGSRPPRASLPRA